MRGPNSQRGVKQHLVVSTNLEGIECDACNETCVDQWDFTALQGLASIDQSIDQSIDFTNRVPSLPVMIICAQAGLDCRTDIPC